MALKLQFDSTLDYQQQAIAAVRDVFKGEIAKPSLFSVTNEEAGVFDTGVGNHLHLGYEDVLENIRSVQLRNGLPQSEKLNGCINLDVEMETGTGKTYVYLRSILELNKAYGFTKFVIVVPSVAIREGVQKTLDITKEHFRALYNNVNYDYFVYSGDHVENIRGFATVNYIQIMIINIQSFEKESNIINNYNDKKFGEYRPIDLLKAVQPIVIIDEPQSVISTAKRRDIINNLNPLCTIRYSATPIEVENKIYKLDAIDSFRQKLVKKIEVSGFSSKDSHNEAYLCLKSVSNKNNKISAKIELDIKNKKGIVSRKIKTLHQGDDLYEISGGREIYEGYIINDIYCMPGNEYVDFTSRPNILRLEKAIGTISEDAAKKEQIKATIKEHLNKELELNPKKIKVLSLFFIDKVANYRTYDQDGNPCKGKYAEWFEEIYAEVIQKPKYHDLFHSLHNENDEANMVHDGYFSSDKVKKTARWKDTNGTTKADNNTYNLIMKDKEKLLSFDCKIRFIFSHSALKEGWDNPNVFQICTLNETKSSMKKRQEIGRGLRLCVNQEGTRQYDTNINLLTVFANESYDEFARTLQKEYEDDGIVFGTLDVHSFANIQVAATDNKVAYLGAEMSQKIVTFLKEHNYIDDKNKVTDTLKLAVKENRLQLSAELEPYKAQIETVCQRSCYNLPIHDKNDRHDVKINDKKYASLKDLWERIKWKTTYQVHFSTDELLEECRQRMISSEFIITTPKFVKTKAKLETELSGVNTQEVERRVITSEPYQGKLPDIIAYLQNETDLTRKTIIELLTGKRKNKDGQWTTFDDYGNRLTDFAKNPQQFMEETLKIIQSAMEKLIVKGIHYEKIGDTAYYEQERFKTEEVHGYLNSNMLESQCSLYNYVIYDSENEKRFAQSCEHNEQVQLYVKLPDWFKIATPLGNYNPDWALLINENDDGENKQEKLYFVVETKGNTNVDSLRPTEKEKIDCGRMHFKALGNDVSFRVTDNFATFIENI